MNTARQDLLFLPVRLSLLLVILLAGRSPLSAQEYSRGVGVYPGDTRQDVSPTMVVDQVHYRNLALRRAAYQSSSYDANLTAQLVTDGIVDTVLPAWIVTSTSAAGILPSNEREWINDRHPMTRVTVDGSFVWVETEMAGGGILPLVDSVNVSGSLLIDSLETKPWDMNVAGSDDGVRWDTLGSIGGSREPGDTVAGFFRRFSPANLRVFSRSIPLHGETRHRYYRLSLNSANAKSWSVVEFGLYSGGKRVAIGGPYAFTSAWKSAGVGEEWVSVDLGARCSFDRVALHWILRAAAGSVQVSDDGVRWNTLVEMPSNAGRVDDFVLPATRGRFVRVLMRQPASSDGYILSELQVYGTGGPVPVAHPQKPGNWDGGIGLAGGGWKVQRASLVNADGVTLSRPGFQDSTWVVATVPGTVLVSYLNAGALPDPNFADNQLDISDSYFYSDFWYRDAFVPPVLAPGGRMFLNFDGINWKAEVFLNGHDLGTIEGAFTRKRFDVTDVLVPGKENSLAVLIRKNDAPGYVKEQTVLSHDANGGELGADNPTFHASVGWDWIPTIRGRNTGIWNDVYLSTSGPVTIDDPHVSSTLPLPDTSTADLHLSVTLTNRASNEVRGILRGRIGKTTFDVPVTLGGTESKQVELDPSTIPALHVRSPRLWWPNGYGQQNLYAVDLAFLTSDGVRSDAKSFKTGIREMTYSEEGGVLRIWVNGRRFIGKGGNWGFSESMLRYRGREYDIAVRYHKEMNFTMIRNWVGQTGDDEFYEACDRYGIMVWQDFWLANPVDGPNPDDNAMFMHNADDFVRRIRNHPSLALYCGRNEGNPPVAIDTAIRTLLQRLQPDIHYISNSAFGVVSGGGPYRAMPVTFYFDQRATQKLHSEMGMPNMVSLQSLRAMLPDSLLWPIGRLWGMHDFNLESAQHGYSFIQLMQDAFGPVDSLRDWLTLAQWVNYQGYRAMFEAQGKHRMGMLLWMSHPAWPSMVWQTYDYFFEPTAAYFACKKACEPLHIQWNPLSDSIEVVNYSAPHADGLTATMALLNLDGTVKVKKQVRIDCPMDTLLRCFAVPRVDGLTEVSFIRLSLMRGNRMISENFYWRGLKGDDVHTVRNLPKVKLAIRTEATHKGNQWNLLTTLTNRTRYPALMVKLTVIGSKGRQRELPVIYSDNFVSLMPGESR
ncbi:MAG: discoidin domain-containing protein, partial [Bacteroidota bacterium]